MEIIVEFSCLEQICWKRTSYKGCLLQFFLLEKPFNILSDYNWARTHNHLVCKRTLERFRTCFEQGVPWHSDNYRMWIHSESRTWHNKNIQSFNMLFIFCQFIHLGHLKDILSWFTVSSSVLLPRPRGDSTVPLTLCSVGFFNCFPYAHLH